MNPRIFAVAATLTLLLSACGGQIPSTQSSDAQSSSSASSVSASASASQTPEATLSTSEAPTTQAPEPTAEAPTDEPTTAEPTSAEPASAAPTTAESTTEAAQSTVADPVGTNCGKIDRPNAAVSTVILGGTTSCATATTVMNKFYDTMNSTPSQTIDGFTCQMKPLYRETGTYAVCTEPSSAAYVEMRSETPALSGPVADAEAFYDSTGRVISFRPGGNTSAVSCAVENGLAIECDGFSHESTPDQGAAAWNVKMTAGQQPVVQEGRTQGGVYKSFMYAKPLDIGTVVNFQGGSCKALSIGSIECAVYGGGHFILSDQGVQQQ